MTTVSTLIGRRLGDHSVLELIGQGGMGIVYRARDERIGREVAIKVLPSDALADERAKARFRTEALVLSRLNHPNIETLFEFDTEDGIDFIVTEYVPGPTLDTVLAAGLAESEVVKLGVQLADGLAAAHDQGIVHRDLKPNNIRLAMDGRAKILDFGLAKTLRQINDTQSTLDWSATAPGAGTPPYLSPEQLLGRRVDLRTDIYGLGTVLYEMATGRRPFSTDHEHGLVDQILHDVPVAPHLVRSGISPQLEQIILKCLAKDSDQRYQTAREVKQQLQVLQSDSATPVTHAVAAGPWASINRSVATLVILAALLVAVFHWRDRILRRPSTAGISSIAVLPLANLSGDPSQEYFADGMTEQLISELTQIHSLRVISRGSVMAYKGNRRPLSEIARELHADGIIQGSVMRSKQRVRITVELTRTAEEKNLWSQSYEGDLNDILRLQADVAKAITQEIRVNLTSQEQELLASRRTVKPEAYEAYLKGRFYWNKRGAEAAKSVGNFRQALEIDPDYAPAYAGLADYYGSADNLPPRVANPLARRYAELALQKDERLAEAHTALALVKSHADRDWAGAEIEFRRALELSPNQADVHRMYAVYLAARGRASEAVREIRRAQELEPLSVAISVTAGFISYFARDYDGALAHCRNALDLDRNLAGAHDCLGTVWLAKRMYPQAISECQTAIALSNNSPARTATLARAYALSGRTAEARKILEDLHTTSNVRYVSPYLIATIHAALGDKNQALDWLEKAYEDESGSLIWLNSEPAFDNLRRETRFQNLLQRLAFPPAS